ncbi:hypothetical protein C8J55DRAFT_519024 [Lentinula edodes]|uniref:Uncharacterized protein n=1 Tax=Lentinula lateritia TaxID=40482 RepID=A0A9W9A3N4_9AGAR|nr:hypothetical protein C8J55DRAFT_519024 [Lentinula edodes]
MAAPPYRNLLALVSVSLLLSLVLNVYNLKKLLNPIAVGPSPVQPVESELPMTVNPAVLNFMLAQHYEITNVSEWATLVPHKGSRVRFPSKSSFEDDFEVALFHDLHCLDVIRDVFVSMRDGSSAHSPEAEECLGTIRQAILCAADITLEPTEIVCYDGESCNNFGPEASGDNVEHSCRDWVQVREFVESNQEGWDF